MNLPFEITERMVMFFILYLLLFMCIAGLFLNRMWKRQVVKKQISPEKADARRSNYFLAIIAIFGISLCAGLINDYGTKGIVISAVFIVIVLVRCFVHKLETKNNK